ncbi:MAG: hypothetical protein ACRDNY_01040, partial [Gaiellaceae bacterium]
MTSSRRSLLVLLAVAALVASACGGSDSPPTLDEYVESVNLARDRVDFALARITRARSSEELLNRMDEASAAIDDAASELEDAGAAEGYEDETSRLTGALHQLSVDLSATAHDIAQPEFGGILSGGSGFQGLNFESWDKANLALASLIGDGLDV